MPKKPRAKKRLPEPDWLTDLRQRKQPLSLAIDEQGYVAAWKYSFEGPHDYNLMVWHPEGDLDFGFDDPTRRERYGVDTPVFRRLNYQAKKAHLLDVIADLGDEHLIEDGPPWKDSEKGMEEWLDQVFASEDDSPISEWDNQYCVGHPIYDALTPKERAAYGIRQGNAGGPASDGCVVTAVACSMADLNELIRRKKLPFVVVEDRRN
jgi:hypothetical protein